MIRPENPSADEWWKTTEWGTFKVWGSQVTRRPATKQFSGAWTFLLSQIVSDMSPYALGVLSTVLSVTVSYLAYCVTNDPSIAELTLRAAKLSLIPLGIGVLFSLATLSESAALSSFATALLTSVVYGYLTPLAIILGGAATRRCRRRQCDAPKAQAVRAREERLPRNDVGRSSAKEPLASTPRTGG